MASRGKQVSSQLLDLLTAANGGYHDLSPTKSSSDKYALIRCTEYSGSSIYPKIRV